jgi:hypothetical protein
MVKSLIAAAVLTFSGLAFANDMKPISFTSSPALGMQANGREVEQMITAPRPYALTGSEYTQRSAPRPQLFTAAGSPNFRANNSR